MTASDRRADLIASAADHGKPAVLRRPALARLCLTSLALIVWGTLGPLGSHGEAWLNPAAPWYWLLPWRPSGRDDLLTNFLVYVPVGIAARLTVRRRGRAGWRDLLIGLAFSAFLSYATEFTQQFMPARCASFTDFFVNSAAALIGGLLAPHLQRAIRELHARMFQLRRRHARTARRAVVLAAALMVTATAQPALHRVFQRHASDRSVAATNGWVSWLPFCTQFEQPVERATAGMLRTLALYAALSVIGLYGAGPRGQPAALLLVVGLAISTECGRVLFRARSADVTPPILAIAAWLLTVRVWSAFRPRPPAAEAKPAATYPSATGNR